MNVASGFPNESIKESIVETPRLRQYQARMMALMLIGYAGYYLCRADYSVSTPLLIKQFHAQGVDKAFIGRIASLGTLAYAFGKFVSGSIADFAGGKRMFLAGMGGAIACTLLFGAGGLPLFTIAWAANRLIQSAGWVGMVKLTSKWFSYSTYGAAMGIISLSYLFGDFFSRLFLGRLIKAGFGWQHIFYVSAAVLGVIFVANLLLKEAPRTIGEAEPSANPANVFGAEGQQEDAGSLRDLLLPLLCSSTFWIVCALSFGFTLARETFGNWTPLYLVEVAHMDAGTAATYSSLFPLFGGLSVLLAGFLSDKLGRTGRAKIILTGLLLSIPLLLLMAFPVWLGGSVLLTLTLLGLVAFVLIGPYSFLAGAISLDFGGKKGSATAAGWIDGIGYIGGILAGEGVGKLSERFGWSGAFLALAGVTTLSCIAAGVYWRQQGKSI